MQQFHHVGWRDPQRAHNQLDLGVPEGHLDQLHAAFCRQPEAWRLVVELLLLIGGQRRNASVSEQFVDEGDMLGRQDEVAIRHRADLFHFVGQREIETVRPAAGVTVDPAQFLFQPLGVEAGRAQNAHASRPRRLDDHVTAVREGKDRRI